ncbi:hypothetical protein SKA34_15240 [Photobacterium sp. SKA34]|uniref:hypothetical protein n=1 Tax=Photobacterium sp. SKA34 TaxID=121723 RepID=UPI00006B7846|nr:hypothetical protein [Photobacterium sp. SKA34]EAR55768.1 hypothetical protein SKA34_15240 [Photobacterium sp. SKA34]
MFSQSTPAQLIRMLVLLVIALIAVHHCQPLLDALAKHATNGGCHQQNIMDDEQPMSHHHMH